MHKEDYERKNGQLNELLGAQATKPNPYDKETQFNQWIAYEEGKRDSNKHRYEKV